MDINITSVNQSLSRLFHRFHVIIFVVIVFGALGAGIFFIYQNILSADESHGYTAQASNTPFDPATQESLKKLYPSDYRLSSRGNPDNEKLLDARSLMIDGRINPFVE
jgi:hypothetical protein